jgi:hypothetical protein
MGPTEYVGRVKEYGRIERRHSSFLHWIIWLYLGQFYGNLPGVSPTLIEISPNKRRYYQQGQRR